MAGNLHDSIRQLQQLADDTPGHAGLIPQVDEILLEFSSANRTGDAYVSEKIEEVRRCFIEADPVAVREAIYKLSRLVSADGSGIASQDSWSLRNFF